MQERGRKGEEYGAKGNIWTKERESERRMMLSAIFGRKRE